MPGVWLCVKDDIPQLPRQGGGAVVNIASMAGLVGASRMPARAGALRWPLERAARFCHMVWGGLRANGTRWAISLAWVRSSSVEGRDSMPPGTFRMVMQAAVLSKDGSFRWRARYRLRGNPAPAAQAAGFLERDVFERERG